MRIIIFEIKKLFLRKRILIILLMLIIINIIKIYDSHTIYGRFSGDNTAQLESSFSEIYNDINGKMTEEKLNYIISEYKRLEKEVSDFSFSKEYDTTTYTGYIYGDFSLFKWEFFEPLNYLYNYNTYSNSIVSKANENIEFYNRKGNDYEVRKNKIISNIYRNRKITEFYDVNGYENLLRYEFSSLLILLICLFALLPVFLNEKETGMQQLLSTSKKGGTATIKAKYISSLLFVLIICMIFYSLDFLSFHVIYGLDGGNSPIYAIEYFKESPFNISIFSFFILSGIFKTIGILGLSMMFLLISQIFRQTIPAFIASIIVTLSLILLNTVDYINYINPISLISNIDVMRKFSTIGIFETPFQIYQVLPVGVIVFNLILVFLFVCLRRSTLSHKKVNHG